MLEQQLMMNDNNISFDSSTNKRLRDPSRAQTLAQNAVKSCYNNASVSSALSNRNPEYRTIIGLGPGRSGTKSLCELLSFQTNVVHCEHEMIVPRLFPRTISGHILTSVDESIPTSTLGQEGEESVNETDVHQLNKQQCQPRTKEVKGSWGADRRLEWDVPKLARGEPSRSEEDEALWRVLRLLEQRHVFDGWVREHHRGSKCSNDDGVDGAKGKPKKLGTRGWREHNNVNWIDPQSLSSDTAEFGVTQQQRQMHLTSNQNDAAIPVIATISSVGLAYVHEYIALDPSVKIPIVLRPCEEVVASFMMKSKGRNHWQKHVHCNKEEKVKVQRDKTWDNAFPNMSNDECLLVMESTTTIHSSTPTSNNESKHRPEKIWAIRAYCKLYSDIAHQLAQQYPDNVRVFDMHAALNDADVQFEFLKWCGVDQPFVDTSLHLNKKR